MKTGIRIYQIEKVSDNTLNLFAYVHRFDVNRTYHITYYYADLDTDIPLSDISKEKLLSLLKKDIGHGPFKFTAKGVNYFYIV